jgi:predicted lipoprotein
METINKTVVENPDSIEMGSAAKGIKIKVYGDFSKLDEFKKKIDNARASKDYAIQILG